MSIKSYIKHREGIGSSFHLEDTIKLDFVHLNFDYEIFYSGRQAFKYILDEIHRNSVNNNINKLLFVYNDLKGDNICVGLYEETNPGLLKLIDFGLATRY